MKRRIYSFILFFALIFAMGCNKEKNQPDPTPTVAPTATATPSPTATPTPTPIPENLAKTALEKLPAAFDKLMSYQPETNVDLSKGAGYDIEMELTLGNQIANLLGLGELKSVSLSGTMDMKDILAANLYLYLGSTEVTNAHIFADSSNLLFTLPEYSSTYAKATWEELLEETELDSDLLGSSDSVISTINTVDTTAPLTDEALTKLLRTHIEKLVDCFRKVDGITEDVAIGTGDYTLTGDKHTVVADKDELIAVLTSLEAELGNYMEADLNAEELLPADSTTFILEYYIADNGDYAWAAYPDTDVTTPLVFVNTSLGFCLYKTEENGEATIGMNSVKSTENSGVINLLFDEGETPMGVIDYKYGDNSFYIDATLDTIELTVNGSTANETLSYDITMVVEGMSILMKQTTTKDSSKLSCTLASYGIEYGTLSVSAKLRDYVDIPVPQNTTDLETWANNLDSNALTADLLALAQEYPFIMNLLLGSGEEESGDTTGDDFPDVNDNRETGSFTIPEGYTDEFMEMTGYFVTEDGFVDFEPLEEEVLAIGKPSTGFNTVEISDTQIQTLAVIATQALAGCEQDTYTYYSIWGDIASDSVRSYYTISFEFSDPNSWDNNITYTFDTISGELYYVDIYNESKEEALRIANEIYKVLGGTTTLTAELVENYMDDAENELSISGYDGTEYGGNYYSISISATYSE